MFFLGFITISDLKMIRAHCV